MKSFTYLKIISKNKKSQTGFTLIEMLVSMSLFTIVVGMSVGTLIVLIDANSKAQNVQVSVTNVSFALDGMSREIRTGTFYECQANSSNLAHSSNDVKDCAGLTNFAFTEAGGSLTDFCTAGAGGGRIAYRLNNNSIERRLCDGDGVGGANDPSDWLAITAPDVVVDELRFTVENSDRSDNASPLVTIFIQGSVPDIEGIDTAFGLQSSLTQQALDI